MWLFIFSNGAESGGKGQICLAAFFKVFASAMIEVLGSGEKTDEIFFNY